MSLANFWRYVNIGKAPEEDIAYEIPVEARMFLHCLSHYPNEFWKYPISVFFVKNQDSESFEVDLTKILKKLVAFLFSKFIEAPTVNAIKDEIYSSCISLNNENKLQFRIAFNEEIFNVQLDAHSSSKLTRSLLLLDAYLNPNQLSLISPTFDIEHVLPKKWQEANYDGWSYTEAGQYLDRLGNKVVLEKKLNIQAGNGYFGIKKQKYSTSAIASVLELSNYPKNDWTKEDIEKREVMLKDNLIRFLKEQLIDSSF
jgi:hypothetical protein